MARWVFLAYRLPREPSSPRIALWRALQRLGAALVADGVAALPESARNVEHFEWLAASVTENGGSSSVWLAQPRTRAAERAIADQMRDATAAEYHAVAAAARAVPMDDETARRRALRTLRGSLGRIATRDYFDVPAGRRAREAVSALQQKEVRT